MIPRIGKNILFLNASGCGHAFNDGHLVVIGRYTNLIRLDVSRTGLSKHGLLKYFAETSQIINDQNVANISKKVQVLNVSNISGMSDGVLMQISRVCTDVMELDASHTRFSELSFRGVDALVKSSTGPKLVKLVFRGCHLITNDAFALIGIYCQSLEFFDCSGAFQMGDAGIQSILFGCKFLKHLDSGYCWRITDDAFSQFGSPHTYSNAPLSPDSIRTRSKSATVRPVTQIGQHVATLNVQFCYQLSDRVMDYLVNARTLKNVNISNCMSVTEAAKDRLRSLGATVI